MQGTALAGVLAHLGPCPAFEYLPGMDRLAHQLGPLRKYPAHTKGIVPYFGISHIIIRRHAHGCPVGL